ncbi:MAG: DNA-directed RNA polymerase subunit alpha C-terminal domain-containing protein [Planctomycetota bacterium]
MITTGLVDVRDVVLSNNTFGPREIEGLTEAIVADFTQFGVLRDAVAELESREDRSPASSVRLGVCLYLMGRYARAGEVLASADGGALAHFYQGKSRIALGNYEQAVSSFQAAKVAGYNSDDCTLAIAEAHRLAKKPTQSLALLDKLSGAVEQTAEYLYQRAATVAAIGGNPSEVCALYERAVESDERHAGALFGLAMENDRRGNDDTALQLYLRSSSSFPTHVGTLLNLGVLYEDRQQYERAQNCYQRILDAFPDHQQARLYLKDAAAAGELAEEGVLRQLDRTSQVLNRPISDFELSVRSRNVLMRMEIKTVGDLTRVTEQELLSSKNFGETSLVEIRDMLTTMGLRIGEFAHERVEPEPVDPTTISPDAALTMERPVSDLNLSVRARKCMVRLGINTLGELIRRTGDELLECKNFGVTSLEEVREKLKQHNMKLRGD